MNVRELIDALSKLNPDLPVLAADDSGTDERDPMFPVDKALTTGVGERRPDDDDAWRPIPAGRYVVLRPIEDFEVWSAEPGADPEDDDA